MQFQAVCKDKPLTLAPLHRIGLGFLDPNSSAATTSGRSNYLPSPALLALLGPKASSTSSVFGVTSVSEVNNSPLKQPPLKQPLLKQHPPNQPPSNQHFPNQPPPNQPPPNQPPPNQPSVPSVFGMVQLVELIRTAPPELVDTAVESLLDRLNKDNVDMISDDIARWANKSKGRRDSTIDQVISLVVKKAIDNPTQSDTYTQLCFKLRAQVGGKVRDDVTNVRGLPFKTRLVARCTEHFDRDWNVMEVIMAGVVSSKTVHVVNKKGEDGKGEDGVDESKLASLVSESDKRQAAKQARRLGLIKFTVELFKVQMVGKDVIHQYAKRLIEANNPGDQRIEGLCELLKQVYFMLDGRKDRAKMDGYFRFMEELGKRPGISPHIRSILQVRGLLSFMRRMLTVNRVFEKDGKNKVALLLPNHSCY